MTSRRDFVQPPRIATWLVNQFTSGGGESIVGDLLEEFSHLASKSEVAIARRWYWRQTVKTIAHLFTSGFRDAPWSTTAAVISGFVLLRFASGLPDQLLSAITDRYLAYWSNHFRAYMFWATDGMLVGHLILSMFVGCFVALVAKGREMVATMTLGLVLCVMAGVGDLVLLAKQPMDDPFAWMLFQSTGPLAIVVGGIFVRARRSAAKTLRSA